MGSIAKRYLILLAFFISPFLAEASTYATFTFDNYSTSNLDGQDGWTAGLVYDVMDQFIVTRSCKYSTGKCLELSGNGQTTSAKRYFSENLTTSYSALRMTGYLMMDLTIPPSSPARNITIGFADGIIDLYCGIRIDNGYGGDPDNNFGFIVDTGSGPTVVASTTAETAVDETWYYFQLDYDTQSKDCSGIIGGYSFDPVTANVTTASTTYIRIQASDNTFADDITVFTDPAYDEQYIPPANEDYIVIIDPVESNGHANVSYSDTFTILLNNTNGSLASTTYYASSSYIVNIQLQNGQWTSITGSTTDGYVEQIVENVTFTADDIALVSALLYDGLNFDTLIDRSPTYTWWISANANPLEPVDLGSFHSQAETCMGFGQSTSSDSFYNWTDGIGFVLCRIGQGLFIPNQSSLNYISSQLSTATGTAPFSYVYDLNSYMDTLFTPATTSFNITVGTSSDYLGEVTLFDSSSADSNSNFQLIRSFMGFILLISLPLYTFRRVKNISANL